MEVETINGKTSKTPFGDKVQATPYFGSGVLNWYNDLDDVSKELLPFLIVDNPIHESKKKIVSYLENHQLISYDIARDFRLIPSDMTPQKFFKILNEDIMFEFRRIEGLRSNCKAYYEVVE